MKNISIFLFTIICFLSLTAQAQDGKMIYSAPKEKSLGVIYRKPEPHCVIKIKGNLTVVRQSEIKKMNSEWFDKVEVFKGQTAIDLYGEKAKDGAIVITIKDEKAEEAQQYLNTKKE